MMAHYHDDIMTIFVLKCSDIQPLTIYLTGLCACVSLIDNHTILEHKWNKKKFSPSFLPNKNSHLPWASTAKSRRFKAEANCSLCVPTVKAIIP